MPRFLRYIPPFKLSMIIVLAVLTVFAILLYMEFLELDTEIDIAVGGGIVLAILALIQIHTNSVLQRANVVKLVSMLYTDRELAETFHVLVYSYDDKTYKKYKKAKKTKRDKMNKKRQEGLRFFNPDDECEFSGSKEEMRIDSLLGYMDIIAYHYHRRLIKMVDIAGVLGYHLATIRNRQAITNYLRSIRPFWEKAYSEYGSNSDPLRYLNYLLDEHAKYCKRKGKL